MLVFQYMSELVPGPFPCFVCEQEMTYDYPREVYWCARCEVSEVRFARYVNRTELLSSFTDPVTGEEVLFVDHGTGHYPSPA